MAYVAITAGQVDSDSPLDTTLMGTVKDNFIDHESRLVTGEAGGFGVADGAITQAKMATAAVGQGELKTATGEVSTSAADINLTLPGGTYGFYPQIKTNALGGLRPVYISNNIPSTSYVTNIFLTAQSGTSYAQQRYIQASPPYKIGDTVWGHFLFLLRKISTGDVVSSYQAEDPPWAYNGKVWLPKNHVDRISEVPHPFADYWLKDPAIDGLEIVLVNLNAVDTKKWRDDNWKVGKSILEDIPAVLPSKGKLKTFADFNIPAIARFTDRVKVIEP